MSRILLVGAAPSRVMQPDDRPFQGTRALANLARHANVSPPDKLYDLFDFENVIRIYPGADPTNSKYDQFPRVMATTGGQRIRILLQTGKWTHVVTLGANACMAVYAQRLQWFDWHTDIQLGGAQLSAAASPHPGGTSMFWNDPEARAQGEEFWRSLVAAAS